MDTWAGLLPPSRRHPIYGGFAYLVPSRWVLGFDTGRFCPSPADRLPAPRGTPRNAPGRQNGGIPTRVRNFRDSWPGLWFSSLRRPVYGGFAYLVPSRGVLVVEAGAGEEAKRPGQESLKFRTLFVIPPLYRSVAPRGAPGATQQTNGRKVQLYTSVKWKTAKPVIAAIWQNL